MRWWIGSGKYENVRLKMMAYPWTWWVLSTIKDRNKGRWSEASLHPRANCSIWMIGCEIKVPCKLFHQPSLWNANEKGFLTSKEAYAQPANGSKAAESLWSSVGRGRPHITSGLASGSGFGRIPQLCKCGVLCHCWACVPFLLQTIGTVHWMVRNSLTLIQTFLGVLTRRGCGAPSQNCKSVYVSISCPTGASTMTSQGIGYLRR